MILLQFMFTVYISPTLNNAWKSLDLKRQLCVIFGNVMKIESTAFAHAHDKTIDSNLHIDKTIFDRFS
jgi:hypothetical protein